MNNKIRVARAEVRMTQQQLADAADVSRQTINAIESGKFVPSTVLALKMAKIFSKSVEDIFQLDDKRVRVIIHIRVKIKTLKHFL